MAAPVRRSSEASGGISGGNGLSIIPAGGCFGDGCEALEPWPVHQVRYRNNVFLRLCTSCVLKHHPGSFCCSCFDVLDTPERPPLVHCSKCPSVSHLCCLPGPSMTPLFLCPACDSPCPTSFSYFPYSRSSSERIIDMRAAKILLAAARLSAASMSRAVALAGADAEKKVKEAALARKRARDMLDRSLVISEKEKEKRKSKDSDRTEAPPVTTVDIASVKVEVAEPKKKSPRPSCTVTASPAAQKRTQDREREKWKRFSEPIGLVNRSTLVGFNDKLMGHINSDVNDGGVMVEKESKGLLSGSLTGISEE